MSHDLQALTLMQEVLRAVVPPPLDNILSSVLPPGNVRIARTYSFSVESLATIMAILESGELCVVQSRTA